MTEAPPGLFTPGGELTQLGVLVDDAADCLCVAHDYLDPDADEWPNWALAQLVELWHEGSCAACIDWGSPDALVEHFLRRKQDEHERALPVWTCDCGAVFKLLVHGGYHFHRPAEDGVLGDEAGSVDLDGKGRVKDSDACPACSRSFASTIARRSDPQGSLF